MAFQRLTSFLSTLFLTQTRSLTSYCPSKPLSQVPILMTQVALNVVPLWKQLQCIKFYLNALLPYFSQSVIVFHHGPLAISNTLVLHEAN